MVEFISWSHFICCDSLGAMGTQDNIIFHGVPGGQFFVKRQDLIYHFHIFLSGESIFAAEKGFAWSLGIIVTTLEAIN